MCACVLLCYVMFKEVYAQLEYMYVLIIAAILYSSFIIIVNNSEI